MGTRTGAGRLGLCAGVILVGTAGCDGVFGLDSRPAPDAGPAVDAPSTGDEDGDTRINDDDNCPVTFNTDQRDGACGRLRERSVAANQHGTTGPAPWYG